MKLNLPLALLLLVSAFVGPLSSRGSADEGPLDTTPPKGVSSDEIIKHFADKEKEFQQALDQYAYRQSVKVQTLEGDTVDGEYQQVFDVSFDNQGHKIK